MLFHIRFVLLNVVLDSFISSVFFFFYNFIIFVPNFLQAGNFGVIFTASWLFIDTFLVSEDDEIVSDPLMLFFIGQGMIMECHIPCAFIANGKHISFLSPFHATIKSSYKNLLPKVLFKVLIGKVEQKINLLLLQC
ncbi:hypothetical protein S83_020908 [Arachis hypogaea]